jgi:DNA-binding NtrC family response regulator
MGSNILIVDDDADTLKILSRILEAGGHSVSSARNAVEAMARLGEEEFPLVLTDLVMPGTDGLELTRQIRRENPETAVMIITAFASIETAVEAMRAGALDYITKPIIPEELHFKVDKALEQHTMRRELGDLKAQLSRTRHPPNLIGVSPRMRQVFQMVTLVAGRDVPVILTGESGTGKELVAKAIHGLGQRSSRPFVAINCGAVPETLLESELFGFAKGAFTGAVQPKRGLFEEAHGGSLFLDEIGETPPSIQIKLLRALQDGQIRRLGSTQSITTDVRVLVATNRNLHQEIAEGRFREDLYYRLSVVTIQLPPLRDRKEDIPLLVDHFIHIHRPSINPDVSGISAEAQARMVHYDWPGNVRELENTIRRALVLCRTDVISPADIVHLGTGGAEEQASGASGRSLGEAAETFQRAYFIELLERRRGNVKQVAEDAGVSRKNVYEYLKRLGLDPAAFRTKS